MIFTVAELTFCETAQVYKTRTNISIANTSKKQKQKTLVAFIFRVSHHVMIRYHQYEDEHAKEIGKEAEVLIVNHL